MPRLCLRLGTFCTWKSRNFVEMHDSHILAYHQHVVLTILIIMAEWTLLK